jgi:hypothetical protein
VTFVNTSSFDGEEIAHELYGGALDVWFGRTMSRGRLGVAALA